MLIVLLVLVIAVVGSFAVIYRKKLKTLSTIEQVE